MKLSVVIPVFNEIGTIEEVLRQVQATPFDKEIVVVDDASTDGTREKLLLLARQNPVLKVILHEKNKGKGAALRTGFRQVSGDIVLVQDADLEYRPSEYDRLLHPILNGEADVVFGSRFLAGPHRVLYFWHYLGNKALTTFSNLMTNLNLTDMETCYKAFRRQVLEGLVLRCNRFGFEPEFTAKVAKRRYRIFEVPISYYGRTYAEGKKIGWRDAIKALLAIVRFRLMD